MTTLPLVVQLLLAAQVMPISTILLLIHGRGQNGLLSATGAPTAQDSAGFGGAVALSATYALVGASAYDYTPSGSATAVSGSGNAYLYNIITNSWTGTNGLLSATGAPTAQDSAGFGGAVALYQSPRYPER